MPQVLRCFKPRGGDPAARRNEEIEKKLRQDKKKQEREVKILLLGAGESGKSTILKQMRLLYADGFKRDERKSWKNIIFHNLIDAFLVLFEIATAQRTALEDPGNLDYVRLLNTERDIGPNEPIPIDYLHCFADLWSDAGIQLAMLKGNEYALHDNLNYFLEDIDRLFARDYLPTDQDILRTRLRTTGITETIFELGSLTYRMFDVGGQRSERKKWIHIFDNVNVVLFLAAISGYDQGLLEDRHGNQMTEALMLFEQIANSRYFDQASLILFLNKMDLFREKMRSGISPISRYFSDYTSGTRDTKAGQAFFADKFKKLLRKKKELYIHFTNATDTNLLKVTMKSVQDMIVQRNLNQLVL